MNRVFQSRCIHLGGFSTIFTDVLSYMTKSLPFEVITILRLFADVVSSKRRDVYSSRSFRPSVLAKILWYSFLEASNR